MAIIKGLEHTFDTVADIYEKYRPGYVEGVYQSIFDRVSIGEHSNVVEVGIGAGQATQPVLQKGCRYTAVEYGKNFSDLCREKFAAYPRFSVINDKFENVDFTDDSVDLVFAASAFHWIPEEIGYPKVFSMLRSGGVFARFANHPFSRDKGNPALSHAIDALYREYYYTYYNKPQEIIKEYTEQQAKERAYIAKEYGFTEIAYKLFYRTRTFSAKEYTALLNTYSDHIAIEESVRRRFFEKIEEAICDHGGNLTIYDTIDLQLATKP